MQRGKENFEGKEVLILGGGDGALLYELLKEKPKFVTMLEIDDVVMNACKKYLQKCCGTCLDEYNAENYKVTNHFLVSLLIRCLEIIKQYLFVAKLKNSVSVKKKHI